MTRAQYTVTASIDIGGTPTDLPVQSGTVAMDETWSPYIQASLVCVTDDPTIRAALDPRTSPAPVVTLSLGQTFGTWNAFTRSDSQLVAELVVRSSEAEDGTSIVALALASDEARAQDYGSTEPAPLWMNQANWTDAVDLLLAEIGSALEPGSPAGPDDQLNFYWMPGQTIWDSLEPILQQAGLRLYADEQRKWYLVESPVDGTDVALLASLPGNDRITSSKTTYSVEGDSWADSVVVEYVWPNPGTGNDEYFWDIANSTPYSKTLTLEYRIPYPGSGAAAKILARQLSLGQSKDVEAASNFDLRPGDVVGIFTAGAWTSGKCASVEWAFPDNTMTVRTRDLIDASSRAWILADLGTSWLDVSAGIAWTAYTP